MLIKEIIDDINVRYPNQYSEAQLIKWINQVTEDNWEDLATDEIYITELETGKSVYALPNTIDFSGITSVIVNEKEYTAKPLPDYKTNFVYFKESENKIALNPKPGGGEEMFIFHLAKPSKVENVTDDLRIRPQFAEIIKNAIFIMIAKAAGEVDLANNYVGDFNASVEDARQRKVLYSAAYPKVRDNRAKK
ncbi:MAG: hypothetical protein FWE47_01350 [Oscillospiraceae bacterium]|nr:hypothetical protein [Oscillospiraceae bacterium]